MGADSLLQLSRFFYSEKSESNAYNIHFTAVLIQYSQRMPHALSPRAHIVKPFRFSAQASVLAGAFGYKSYAFSLKR